MEFVDSNLGYLNFYLNKVEQWNVQTKHVEAKENAKKSAYNEKF